jgi:hypothetical protein
VRRAAASLRERGAEIVVVGCGSRTQARAFREEVGWAGPLFVDKSRGSYRALGFRRGVFRALGGSLPHLLRALRAGFRQRGVQGDPWQLGGVLVVLPSGEIAYRFESDAAGHHPPMAEVLAALG